MIGNFLVQVTTQLYTKSCADVQKPSKVKPETLFSLSLELFQVRQVTGSAI